MIAFLGIEGPNFASSRGIAEHQDTRASILHQLSKNCDVQVRMAVADNRNTRVNTMMQLALDEDLDLRYALAENHNIDTKVLELLSDDANPYIASRAKRTLARLEAAISPPRASVAVLGGTYGQTSRSVSRRIS